MSVGRKPVSSAIELTTDDLVSVDVVIDDEIDVDVDEATGLITESGEHELAALEPTSRRAAAGRRGTAPVLSPWRRSPGPPNVAIADAIAAQLREAFARAPVAPLPVPRAPEPRVPVTATAAHDVPPSVAPVALASVAPAPAVLAEPSRWPTRVLAGVTVLLAAAALAVRLTALTPAPVVASAPPPSQEPHVVAAVDAPAPSVVAFDEPVAITVARPTPSLRELLTPPLTLGSASTSAPSPSHAPARKHAPAQLRASSR